MGATARPATPEGFRFLQDHVRVDRTGRGQMRRAVRQDEWNAFPFGNIKFCDGGKLLPLQRDRSTQHRLVRTRNGGQAGSIG
jgi:hypothetical protein